MRVDRLLANLGYGSRREVAGFLSSGRVTQPDGTPVSIEARVGYSQLRFDGLPLDPPAPLTLIMHKPAGYTCSNDDAGPLIYDLLPPRFSRRNPSLAIAGRLDKDTSGLLILTDDGTLLHRIISPKKEIWKTYEATLARPLSGREPEVFASGTLLLHGETNPCRPAKLDIFGETRVRVSLTEGRYHQVRRMFAAVGNHVETLHRSGIGQLNLEGLPERSWRALKAEDLKNLFQAG
ncbi:MAG: pseudouridine synthase [Verrucomicrobiales bacterium]